MGNLQERLAAALQNPGPSAELKALQAEIVPEHARMTAELAALRDRSLDPTRLPALSRMERNKADDLQFALERLEVGQSRLSEAISRAEAAESAANTLSAYERVKSERDRLVIDLAEYPALAGKIAGLLQRLEQNDAEIRRTPTPAGREVLQSAECVVRGIPSNFTTAAGGTIPRLTENCLVSLQRGADLRAPFHWHQDPQFRLRSKAEGRECQRPRY